MNSEYLCDTEVNLCYSNPCGHNGSCAQHESGFVCSCLPGFTGERCEIDIESKKYSQCPKNICRHPSRCAPLIQGGIRCEICPSREGGCTECQMLEHQTKFCELRTRSFPNGSFLLFPSLKRRHRFQIRLSIATREKNALLLYNGRYNNRHDFIALEIVDGQAVFSFSLGTTVSDVTARRMEGISDGKWHQITVDYYNRTVTLTVGSDCDTQLSLLYGSVLPDYKCAATVTQKLEERCSDITESCHRLLDLTGPLQLGSLPDLTAEHQVHSSSFVGCMRDLHIDRRLVDMNDHAWNSDTLEGCPYRKQFCESSPCRNGGTCLNGWGQYICECRKGWTGKDCSQESDLPVYSLMGRSHLLFTQANHGLANIRLPWFNGLSFRTRQPASAVLLTIEIGETARNDRPYEIVIQLVNGSIVYSHPLQTVTFDAFPANDGEWHYLETRWLPGELIITLDYGHFQKSSKIGDWIVGQTVGHIVVGRRLTEDGNSEGFVGCVKAIRVGSSPGILLLKPEAYNAELGCEPQKLCGISDVCPRDHSSCTERWNSYECLCSPGRIGSDCKRICDTYDPCRNGATCVESLSSSRKYSCHCNQYHTGEYCELVVNTTCPSTWWGSPICGPCNCPKERGFNSRCNKTTGECYCRENHYHQGELCIPCNCYEIGSIGRSCDRSTGLCLCRKGVAGRRCDSCHSRFAEVTLRGCEVVYDSCPRAYSGRVWWRRTRFLKTAYEDCPEGSVGVASRFCNETEGWKEPDLSNCTSVTFLELGQQLKLIERQDLKMSTFLVKGLLLRLEIATRETVVMRRMDINIAYRLLVRILNYESRQTGLDLSHTQDRNFIQYLANCLSRILEPAYLIEWMRLNQESDASISLLKSLEMYSITLASNMLVTFTQPMDAVSNNIVIGLDFLASNNLSHVVIPKYNNKVQSPAMFDKTTKSLLPAKIFASVNNDWRNGSLAFGRHIPTISYVLFRTLGDLLPHRYDESVRQTVSAPVVVNSPLFMLNIFNGDKMIEGEQLPEPVRIQFLPRIPNNHSNAQCVHWSQTQPSSTGTWSTEGCRLSSRQFSEQSLVECHCDHLTTFGVLMEARSAQASLDSAYRPDLSMWVCAVVAIVCFAITVVILCILLRTGTNLITIHVNLMVVLLLSDATFLAGIDRVEPKIVCRLIAILLQYFLMSSFTWVFVESLHLYRMITSIVDISRGPMHFYCAIGYVVPGIITGLSVGLSTDSYGNQFYCWLKLHDVIFLTFAGSVVFVILISAILFLVSLGTSCRGLPKHSTTDRNYMKYEIGAGSILLILMALGLFFGVLSLHEAVPAFQYLFSGFTCLQGLFALTIYVILNKEVKSQLNYMRYSKKDDARLPSYSRSHSLGSAAFYGSASRNPVSLASNNTLNKPTANNPIALSSEVESYAPHTNTDHPLYATSNKAIGQQKHQSIPLTNISRAKTNDRVSNYSDSENSDTQNHEGGELASSHSSDEDCESYNQAQKR